MEYDNYLHLLKNSSSMKWKMNDRQINEMVDGESVRN